MQRTAVAKTNESGGKNPDWQTTPQESSGKPCRLDSAGFASRWTLFWLSHLISTGNSRQLRPSDLDELPTGVKAGKLGEGLEKKFEGRLLPALWSLFRKDILKPLPLFILLVIVVTLLPVFIQQFLRNLTGKSEQTFVGGWESTGIILVLGTMQAFVMNKAFLLCSIFGVKVRSAIENMVFRKSLRLSAASRAALSAGDVLNLMSQDSERLFLAGLLLHSLGYSFMVLLTVASTLAGQIGVSGIAGILFALLLVPLTIKVSEWIGTRKRKMLRFTDERVSFSAEMLQGIQTVKMQAWEDQMKARINNLREEEIVQGHKVLRLLAFNSWQAFVVPPFMAAVTFGILAATGTGLDVATIYTVLAYLNILVLPLELIPRAAGAMSQGLVSVRRIERFMNLTDVEASNSQFTDSSEKLVSVSLSNCTMFWTRKKNQAETHEEKHRASGFRRKHVSRDSNSDQARNQHDKISLTVGNSLDMEQVEVLHNVNLKIHKNELVVVVGEVGAGKSSLLAGILGEAGIRPGGEIVMPQSTTISYVPQEPWIQNESLRNNVLFTRTRAFDREMYNQVIQAVQMEADLQALPKSDDTEIGSRGINLSGGQKSRVGFARAVYHALSEQKAHPENDVLIVCDDPFSALDPHVAMNVWDEVVEGLLQNTTRLITLNSNLSLASRADKIVVLEDGKISGYGNPKEILSSDRYFWLFNMSEAKPNSHAEKQDSQTERASHLDIPSPTQVPRESSCKVHSSPISEQAPSSVSKELQQEHNAGKLYKAEEKAEGVVHFATYWAWLKNGSILTGPWASFIVVFGLYLTTQGAKVFSELWLGNWSRTDPTNFRLGLGVYFGVVAFMVIFGLLRSLSFVRVSANASVKLHSRFVDHLLHAPINLFFDVTPSGRILNRLSNDLDHMDTRLPEVALQLMNALFQILGAIVLAVYASPFIILALLPLSLLFGLLARRLARTQRELKRFDAMSRSPLFSHFNETLAGLASIRTFRLTTEFLRENERLTDMNANFFLMFWLTARWFALRVDLLAVLCQFSILALGWVTRSEEHSPAIGLAVSYSLLLTTSIQAATRSFVETQNSMVACERIVDFIDNVPQERENGSKEFLIRRGDVKFENVYVRYRPYLDFAVRNLSFEVKGGQKLGICGRSGAAKSTIGNILFGILQIDQGNLYFDGVESREINLGCLRRQLSVIPQQPIIFSGTLRFALDPFNQCNSDEEIWQALRQVEMEGFVRNLPGVLDGNVDENAASFSVGERQLLCIARCLLRRNMTRIVLLDESTASVDAHSDMVVQSAIHNGFSQATVFIIAHRLHTIIDSDWICVMENGALKEFGPPNELLQRPAGMFRQMWELETSSKKDQ